MSDEMRDVLISTSGIGKWDKGADVWTRRLNAAVERRKKYIGEWRENREYADRRYRKELDTIEGLGKDMTDDVRVNKIPSWMRRKMAALTVRRPQAILSPSAAMGYEMVQVATGDIDEMGQPVFKEVPRHKVLEGVVNHIAGQPSFGLAPAFRRSVRNGLTSMGVSKVGFSPEFANDANIKLLFVDEDGAPSIDPQTQTFITAPKEEAGTEWVKEYVCDDKGRLKKDGNGRPVEACIPVSQRWFIESLTPDNMLFDPNGEEDFYDHEWVAQEYYRRLADVKRDPLLKHTRDLKATVPEKRSVLGDEKDYEHLTDKSREDEGWVRMFDIFSFRDKRWLVMAEGCGQYLRDDPIPAGIDHSPYSFLRFMEKTKQFEPHPPESDLVSRSREIDALRTLQLAQARRAHHKVLLKKGVMDHDQKGDLTSPEDVVIEVDYPDGPLSDTILPIPYSPVSGDITQAIMMARQDFDEEANQSAEARGQRVANTATQSNNLMQGTSSVEEFERELVCEHYREIYKKLLDSIQANMTADMAVKIEGVDGQFFQAYVNPEMVIGDYDVTVDVEEMGPKNSDVQRAQTIQVMGILAQTPPWMLSDPQFVEGILDQFKMADKRVVDGLVRSAQMQMQMEAMAQQGQANAPNPNGESQPPTDQAQMMAQQGGAGLMGG